MRLSGNRTISATPQAAWGLLGDPERLAAAMPGVDGVERTGPRSCRVAHRLETGLGSTYLNLAITVTDEREPEHARVVVRGVGSEHRLEGTVDVDLVDRGGSTEVRWKAEVTALGVLSSLGQQVIGAFVRDEIDRTIDAAEGTFAGTG